MPRLPARLYGPTSVTAAAATVITVPAGHTYIVRHLHLTNTTGSAATITASIGVDAATTELFTAKSVAANDVYDWFGLLVLTAAETLRTLSGTNNALTLTINGDDYTIG